MAEAQKDKKDKSWKRQILRRLTISMMELQERMRHFHVILQEIASNLKRRQTKKNANSTAEMKRKFEEGSAAESLVRIAKRKQTKK